VPRLPIGELPLELYKFLVCVMYENINRNLQANLIDWFHRIWAIRNKEVANIKKNLIVNIHHLFLNNLNEENEWYESGYRQAYVCEVVDRMWISG
jgi:hypothetical protein